MGSASTSGETPRQPETTSTIDGRSLDAALHPAALASPAYLLVFQGDSTRMMPLPADGELTIGRAEGSELRIDESRVSRTHARLTLVGGQARIADLDSQNGTLVNDEPLVGQRPLAAGDVVVIASTALVFQTSTRAPRTPGFLDAPTFRARAELEFERAARFGRLLSVCDLAFTGSPDQPQVQLALEPVLRRVDLVSWTAADHLALLLPEADAETARDQLERALEAVGTAHAGVRGGLASCPDDGADPQTLLAAARAASAQARVGDLGLASATYRVLSIGEHQVVVADGAMLRLYELVQRLAQSDLAVLVHGETGSGKEIVASALHHFSARKASRLLPLNCAAVQETLLESALFGHERGAFTGATAARAGLLESADGGTVFLDEVGEMSPALQAKLLRALESHRITRVGDTREREVDFRVVAATHRDLEAEVKAGRFREDLFFRLSGATVWLPPLRDRKRELPLLARRFLEAACARLNRPVPVLTAGTLQLMAAHPFRGNVRELKNMMEFVAATVTDPVVEPWHLEGRLDAPAAPPPAPQPAAPPTPRELRPIADEVRELEQKRMLEALRQSEWNQTRAATAIQMPLRTFVTKFKQYDLGRHR